MGKVSIALRGWRFDEEAVFDEDGQIRPWDEISEDDQRRLVRLSVVRDAPCDACWLVHGDDVDACNVPTVVYGEPYAEVVLCDEHEADFGYWYFEAGGERYRGTKEFQDAFHEWFADGGRAPEAYRGIEHVQTDPTDVPTPAMPDLEAMNVELPEEDQVRIDLRDYLDEDTADGSAAEAGDGDDAAEAGDGDDADDLDLGDLDLGADYPS